MSRIGPQHGCGRTHHLAGAFEFREQVGAHGLDVDGDRVAARGERLPRAAREIGARDELDGARLARALGGRSETLMGLAGMGDLILTCTGDLSRNRRATDQRVNIMGRNRVWQR